jgi:hypothetical protein
MKQALHRLLIFSFFSFFFVSVSPGGASSITRAYILRHFLQRGFPQPPCSRGHVLEEKKERKLGGRGVAQVVHERAVVVVAMVVVVVVMRGEGDSGGCITALCLCMNDVYREGGLAESVCV